MAGYKSYDFSTGVSYTEHIEDASNYLNSLFGLNANAIEGKICAAADNGNGGQVDLANLTDGIDRGLT